MRNDYQILGIEEGADEKEIKRAYFKLIRTYSPEKDPERFQEIRAAYERLTEVKEDDWYRIEMETPTEPFAQRMLQQIAELQDAGDYRRALQTVEEAIGYFGEAEVLLFEQGRCCRLEGKTGKAVKCYEKLAARYPDKLLYKGYLAKAYYERGYEKKALAAFREVYGLGWREPDFLICYSQCCGYRDCPEEGLTVLESLESSIDEKSKKKRMMDLLQAYIGMATLSPRVPGKFAEVAGRCRKFLEGSRRYLKEYEFELQSLFVTILMSADAVGESKNKDVSAIKKIIFDIYPEVGEMLQGAADMLRLQVELEDLAEDGRISDLMKWSLEALAETIEKDIDKDGYEYFMEMDALLCQLEEWPKQKGDVEIIREEYGEVYEVFRDFWRLLQSGAEQRRMMKEEMRIEYAKLSRKYEGGHYYEMFPDKQPDLEAVKWDSQENGTFVRDGKKVGRNDPCPCGSGKKYKNCCMRKG